MAKAKAKKTVVAAEVTEPEPVKSGEPLGPERVHQLLRLHAPYEPPARLAAIHGFHTFWDPGVSIRSLAKSHRALFYLLDFPERFAGETDLARWKHIRFDAAKPGETFAVQRKQLRLGEPPAPREVVVFLATHFLETGLRTKTGWVRSRTLTDAGRRVIVGPLHELGFVFANLGDEERAPGVGLAEVCVSRRK